jgi:RNA polymerase sigma-70 factor (ECF subfamily)
MTDPGMGALPSDGEIVTRVLAGDRDAYQYLVQRHQESLFRVAYAMVLDEDVAADVVQDAFVRAFVSLARCRDRTRFRVWLLATLRNRALDHLKEKRRADLSLSIDSVARRAETAASVEPAADERIALRSALAEALAGLSEPLRDAFVLRHLEELSVEETASVLGTSISAVKMRVHRAREQLQAALGADFGGSGDVTADRSRSS